MDEAAESRRRPTGVLAALAEIGLTATWDGQRNAVVLAEER